MVCFMDRVMDIIARYPERSAIVDDRRNVTYKELDEASARVAGYLKSEGIGREQFVQIELPRRAEGIITMMGVIRSGAAFVLLDRDYPKDRREFIRKDVNAVLVVDEEIYSKMQEADPVEGYLPADPHDAAFAVYTSGSTGTPKGVLHEYGNLELFATILPEQEEYPETTGVMVSPFYFVASILLVVNCVCSSKAIHIISPAMLRNMKQLNEYLVTNRIDSIFLSPSYIRMYKEPADSLVLVATGSEPADGLYYEGGKPVIQNIYTMTEAGFPVLTMVLDRAYGQAPAGRPFPKIDLHLIDEEGNRVEGEGKGEICFLNPFVRGYINLPEKTAEAFRNGVYHTADIARRDADGLYYIVGRNDDMFKVNGNRVEPGEIEVVFRAATGLTLVAARGFEVDGRTFICMYYVKREAEARGLLKDGELDFDPAVMEEKLPKYMLPTYYIGLDELPINANGKLVRRMLLPPKNADFKTEYVAPETEEEKLVCDLMAEILGVSRVGVNDDFYLIGGDSLKSIRFITACGEKGYDISDSELFRNRTPKALGKILENRKPLTEEELERLDQEARKNPQPLLMAQQMWADIEIAHPDALHRHEPVLYKMKSDIDVERLRQAVDKVFRHYSVLSTRLVREGDRILQVYDPSMYEPVQVIELTDAEFEKVKEGILRKLSAFDRTIYRKEIYKTESSCYFFLHFHHALTDGTGLRIINDEIFECYNDPDHKIPADHYYYILQQMEERKGSPEWLETEKHYAALCPDRKTNPEYYFMKPDLDGTEFKTIGLYQDISMMKTQDRGNLFYTTAAAIAAAKISEADGAVIRMGYSGRDRHIKMNSAGEYVCWIPVFLSPKETDTPQDLMEQVKEQAEFGMSHPEYSFFPAGVDEMNGLVSFLYQKDIFAVGKIGALIEETEELPMDRNQPGHGINMAVLDNEGLPVHPFVITYSKEHYSDEWVNRFAGAYMDAVHFLAGE